jgi:radical SAM superfamily enzyme YgiQ (UPF0313 family)
MQKKAVILFFPLVEAENTQANYPWALVYLERMIRDLDIDIILIDERLQPNYEAVIATVADRLLFAGVSAMIGYQIVGGIKFSETVKALSSAPLIWGGWFPSVFPEMVLNDAYADYICIGQGEIPFRSFTEKMITGIEISDIPGIGTKKNGVICLEKNEKLKNPIEFPPVDLKLIDANRLIDNQGVVAQGYRGIDYLASTGCPNNCSFCNLALVFGTKWFGKPMVEIFRDLSFLISTTAASHVTFADDNFFASKRFVLSFCEQLLQSDLHITWEANAHVGYFLENFSDAEISLIYQSGCRRIKIGAESGDQQVLDLINKNIRVGDNLKIVRLLKKHHISTRLFTMVCFPQDPDKDFRNTLQLIGKAKLINPRLDANINFYKPIPKTPLFKTCEDYGFVYPATTSALISFFSGKFEAPWYTRDYHKPLHQFLNFYYLFANPFFFRSFPLLWQPLAFLLNLHLYPLIYLRFTFNFVRFPFEEFLFGKIVRYSNTKKSEEFKSVYMSR